MIDPENEELIPIRKVPRKLTEWGRGSIHTSTIYRWINPGIRGVRLEWTQTGGQRCTSVQALKRFFDSLTKDSFGDCEGSGGGVPTPPAGPRPAPAPLGARAKAHRKAERAVREVLGPVQSSASRAEACVA